MGRAIRLQKICVNKLCLTLATMEKWMLKWLWLSLVLNGNGSQRCRYLKNKENLHERNRCNWRYSKILTPLLLFAYFLDLLLLLLFGLVVGRQNFSSIKQNNLQCLSDIVTSNPAEFSFAFLPSGVTKIKHYSSTGADGIS